MSTDISSETTKILYWVSVPLGREQILSGIANIPRAEITVVDTAQATIEQVADHDGLILGDAPADVAAAVLAAATAPGSRLQRLHFLSAGREGFTAAGIPEHITATGPEGASAPALAEHAMALLLALGRGLDSAAANTANGVWDRSFSRSARSLEDQTMVIVGLGKAGYQVATRAKAFGMHTIGVVRTARTGQSPTEAVDEVVPAEQLTQALSRADVVVLTVALTPATTRLINRDTLAATKPGAILINISRGQVVDHDAVIAALEAGTLAGAGLDVTDPEPLPDGHPLWSAPRVLITPHYAGASPLTVRRTAERALDMVRELTSGAAR